MEQTARGLIDNPITVQIKRDTELNAIIESISFGKPFHYKKLTF